MMKKICDLGFLAFIGVLLCFNALADEQRHVRFHVRVLLAQDELNSRTLNWDLTSKHGFILHDPVSGVSETVKSSHAKIIMKKGRLALNGRRLALSRVEIRPKKGRIGFKDGSYEGAFWLVQKDGRVYLINRVDIENYLFSVLRWEGWPGWELEINRVFAVACRTYAVAKVLEARELHSQGYGAFYDITATNKHQTYKGVHEYVELWKVLDDTRGLIMVYDGRPILAMYDVCCGGVIPARLSGVYFKTAPYLARKYPCTHCKNCKNYTWSVTFKLSDFDDWMKSGAKNAVPVKDIKLGRTDSAGIVHEIKIKTNGAKWISVSGSKVRGLLKGIKSRCFTLSKKDKRVTVTGRGFGHHLGLCQYGACAMVRAGNTFKEVLKFYYPGIKFARLQDVNKKKEPGT